MTNDELQREVIYQNKSSALIALNLLKIQEGELLKIKYETPSGEIDSLVAVGVKDGMGPSCYTLISDQSIPLITAILDYRPDVSDTISGSIYLYNDPNSNNYFKYYHLDGDIVEEEITEGFYFTNLDDKKYYYFDSTSGSQRIIDISSNLSEKSSFQGIINVTEERYKELLDSGGVKDDYIYLVNDGKTVSGLYYNFMPFSLDIDPGDELRKRIEALEEKTGNTEWEEESVGIKFSRVKTTNEALSGDPDIVYFTKDESSIIMGGKTYGSTLEKEKKEYLDKLYEDYIKSLFQVTSAVSKSTVNPGTEITVTVNVKNNSISCSSDSGISGTGFLSGKVFSETSPGVYKTSVQITSVGTYSSTLTAVYSGITKTTSVSISCYNNIVYGWSPSEIITSLSDLRDASSVGPKSSSSGEYNFKNTGTGYYYILIPDGTSIASSLDGSTPQGTEGPIPVYFVRQEDGIPGYTIFRIADPQAPSEHTIKFT